MLNIESQSLKTPVESMCLKFLLSWVLNDTQRALLRTHNIQCSQVMGCQPSSHWLNDNPVLLKFPATIPTNQGLDHEGMVITAFEMLCNTRLNLFHHYLDTELKQEGNDIKFCLFPTAARTRQKLNFEKLSNHY